MNWHEYCAHDLNEDSESYVDLRTTIEMSESKFQLLDLCLVLAANEMASRCSFDLSCYDSRSIGWIDYFSCETCYRD